MTQILLLFSLFFGISNTSFAETPSAKKVLTIEEKLKKLEEDQEALKEQQTEFYNYVFEGNGRVNTFLDKKLSLGGFFETALVNLSGTDMKTQTSTGSQIFGLNFAAELSPKFHFVSQFITGIGYLLQNPHNNPNVTPNHRQYQGYSVSSLVAQSYLEYSKTPAFKIQTGLGYVPFGHAYQLRDLFLFNRRGGPQLANAGGTTTVGIAFPLWMGVHILGSFNDEDHRWGYNVYSFSPALKPGTLGGGTRIWYNIDGFTFGVSGQSAENLNDTYYTYGADLSYSFDQTGVVLEYARNLSSAGTGTPESYYIEPYYTFSNRNWLMFVVADYLSYPNLKTSAALVDDGFQKWVFGAGINWVPLPETKYRMSLMSHKYIGDSATINGQERSYYSVDLSCSAAF